MSYWTLVIYTGHVNRTYKRHCAVFLDTGTKVFQIGVFILHVVEVFRSVPANLVIELQRFCIMKGE